MSTRIARRVYLHALTSLHCGTGQAVSVIDLPIARERATGWPVVPGPSVKGVLRAQFEERDWANKAFGMPGDDTSQGSAGALTFTDLRLLCLPVRSLHGTFAYVTSPLALERFRRDGEALLAGSSLPTLPGGPQEEQALVADGSALALDGQLALEDFDLKAVVTPAVSALATALAAEICPDNQKTFVARFAVVEDALFDHLCEHGTEVTARVALEPDKKTVRTGGLWYEETAPAESVFTGWVVDMTAASIDNLPEQALIQIGGNASTGSGLCVFRVVR